LGRQGDRQGLARAWSPANRLPGPRLPSHSHGLIESSNADRLLERGDVLIKFAARTSTFMENVIMAGEKAVKKLSGLFTKDQERRSTCFHVAIYLGEGRTARRTAAI